MPRRIHNSFTRSFLAVVFLFLNGICIASPAIKNTSDNYTHTSSLPFGYDLNNLETTENQLPAQSFKYHSVRRSLVPANQSDIENLYNTISAIAFDKSPKFPSANLYLLPTPAYYTLLFHYTLF